MSASLSRGLFLILALKVGGTVLHESKHVLKSEVLKQFRSFIPQTILFWYPGAHFWGVEVALCTISSPILTNPTFFCKKFSYKKNVFQNSKFRFSKKSQKIFFPQTFFIITFSIFKILSQDFFWSNSPETQDYESSIFITIGPLWKRFPDRFRFFWKKVWFFDKKSGIGGLLVPNYLRGHLSVHPESWSPQTPLIWAKVKKKTCPD